ncbi:MAG: TlpA family protein disulfide reductase [Verrucomicrobia bacterium]|nr:TlpA family protein disulfide reductase [Verrucomicrobiota bacterium]
MKKQIAYVMGLSLALTVVGCTPVDQSTTGGGSSRGGEGGTTVSIPSLRGEEAIDLGNYKGQVVLLDFWATWCPPCRFELPILNKVYSDLKGDGFSIIGMTVDKGSVEKVAPKVAAFEIDYPVGLAGSDVQDAYGGIRAVPTKFLLDRNGSVSKSYVGVVPEEELRADIQALLAQK